MALRKLSFGAVALCLLAGGCGKGTASASNGVGAPPPAAAQESATVAAADFCNSLDDLNSTAEAVGLAKQLAAVRTDVTASAIKAAEVMDGGVPSGSGLGSLVGRLAADLRTISNWVRTEATQADLDADRVPSTVRKSMQDMGYDFRKLQQWAGANCKGQQQGDNH